MSKSAMILMAAMLVIPRVAGDAFLARRAAESDGCYELISDMQFNPLVEASPDNSDSQATGSASCKLCMDGKMTCTATVVGGKSKLIAAHLHVASDGDGEKGSGPAVALFCGDNTPGLLSKGTPYPEECSAFDTKATAFMPNMSGVFVPVPGEAGSAADLVKDVVANPSKYYFNFHSLASFTYWKAIGSSPKGICRGVMKEKKCYDVFSSMQFNNLLQTFPNNPDSDAKGFVACKLCTDGAMSCVMNTYGGKSPIIAAHLHIANDGDGVQGTGPAIGLFCGDNTPGLLSKGTPYPEPCGAYENGAVIMPDMRGVIDPVANGDMSVAQRIEDVAANPGKYYFNMHSLASFSYWKSQGSTPKGMNRGVMQLN